MKYYIYYLHDKMDSIPRYVGQTIYPKERLTNHKSEARKGKSKKCEWIRSCNKNIEIKFILEVDNVSKRKVLDLEHQCIADFRCIGFPLTNSAFSTDHIQMMRESAIKQWKLYRLQ